MSIEIKKNKALDLQIPNFICDGGIGNHLDKYDMLSHLNAYTFEVLLGKPGRQTSFSMEILLK